MNSVIISNIPDDENVVLTCTILVVVVVVVDILDTTAAAAATTDEDEILIILCCYPSLARTNVISINVFSTVFIITTIPGYRPIIIIRR